MVVDPAMDKLLDPLDGVRPITVVSRGDDRGQVLSHQVEKALRRAGFKGVGTGSAGNLDPGVKMAFTDGKAVTGHLDGATVFGQPGLLDRIISASHGV